MSTQLTTCEYSEYHLHIPAAVNAAAVQFLMVPLMDAFNADQAENNVRLFQEQALARH